MKGKITRQLLMDSLKKVGIQQGDTVFIHSDLRPFGFPEEITRRDEILRFYYQGIRDVIGEDGTIAVPAYNYEYARYNLPFDADTSGVSLPLGSFSQYITALPDSIRSLNPLQSIAAIGPNAKKISGGSSLSGYGVTSPWHWLHQLNALFLFLGAPFQSMTFVHHLEQLVGVPHLYFKIFDTPILKNGKTIQ
ncbi:MAG: AAC(3) family N-acetyltransferase, partial [Waddliaceae bacterium]